MPKGHFDYSTYYVISEFAHHLKWEIEHNNDKDKYDYAYTVLDLIGYLALKKIAEKKGEE